MTGIQYTTFSEFLSQVTQEVQPEGIAENLESTLRSWVSYALGQVQTFIEGYRSFNVQFVTKAMVNEFCSTSIFQGPCGKVTQLFAYKPNVDCKRLHYRRVNQAQLDCWMERQRCLCPASATDPSTKIYDSPYCNYVITGEAACDQPYLTGDEDDARFKCLPDSERIFAVGPDYKVYAAPRWPCGYFAVIQWQGINRSWSNSDLVPDDDMLREAVANYVEYKVGLKERNGMDVKFDDAFTLSLRSLRRRYIEEMKEITERDCSAAACMALSAVNPNYETPIYQPS